MRQRQIFILVALGLFLTAGIFFALHGNKEPRYKGRNLSDWIQIYSPLTGESDKAATQESEIAIQAIGTNALPYLLKWLVYEETKTHKRLVEVLGRLPRILTRSRFGEWILLRDNNNKVFLSHSAEGAFRALGSDALPAVPDLARLMQSNNTNDDVKAFRALFALRELGDVAIPVLLNTLTLTNLPSYRRVVFGKVLGEKQSFHGDRSACLGPLLNLLQDQNPFVAAGAATFLGNLGIDPDFAIPGLEAAARQQGHQVRLAAIEAIGRFGPKARPAMPFLVKALRSTNPAEAEAATNALRQVAPEALPNAPTR